MKLEILEILSRIAIAMLCAMASFNCFWYAWLVDYPVKPPMMVFWATYGILFAGGAFIAIFWSLFKA